MTGHFLPRAISIVKPFVNIVNIMLFYNVYMYMCILTDLFILYFGFTAAW